MTSLLWQSDDAARLKWLRENANITANEFARTHAISLVQLSQLEKEGDTAFYSPIIKYQLGKKLLNIWGEKTAAEIHTVSLTETVNSQDAPVNTKSNPKDHVLATLERLAEVSNRDYNPSINKRMTESIRLCWEENIVFSRLVLLVLGLLLGFSVFKGQMTGFREKYFAADAEVVVEVISNNADAKLTKAAGSTVIPPSRDVFIPTPTRDCRWTETPVTLMSPLPKQPAEYVYLMAMNDLSTCVIGQDKPMSTHILKAGEGQTVNGRAPFRIYSDRLSDLKIFFQGRRVILPNQEVSDVLLIESAVE
jgi:transcriptional regulator with XRE-family HTH domain